MIPFARTYVVFVTLAAATFHVGSARAGQAAVAFDTSRYWSMQGGAGVYGWQFTTRSDIQISSLGIYDGDFNGPGGFPGDGLAESHAIAIWDVASPSDPLVSALIPAGTEAPLVSGFRYVSTRPVTLTANREYVIAALYSIQDSIHLDYMTGLVNNSSFDLTVSPDIEIGAGGYWENGQSALVFPEEGYLSGLQWAPFGANFIYTTIVPEPSSFTLSVLATIIFFCWSKSPTRRYRGSGSRGDAD